MPYADPEKYAAYQREWRIKNAERLRLRALHYGRTHREQQKVRKRRAYYRDVEKSRKDTRDWAKAHPVEKAALSAKYAASRHQKTPAWADKKAISLFYKYARQFTKATGVKHHVDHVIPLDGERVCGLHVETNLSIMTLSANAAKFNRVEL